MYLSDVIASTCLTGVVVGAMESRGRWYDQSHISGHGHLQWRIVAAVTTTQRQQDREDFAETAQEVEKPHQKGVSI